MSAILVIATIMAAVVLYWIRCQTRFWYGVVEVIVAILIIWLTFYPQTGNVLLVEQSPWRWLTTFGGALAGMYVFVRGLDNIENGLSLCSKELYRRRKAGSMLLRMNNLAMPPAFPVEQFNLIHEACDRFREHANYLQFQGAWNAVAYRYKAMIEYDERFTASASVAQVGAGPADRYPQERDLFGFASSAYSMFDALHYAMYAIGSFSDASNFPPSTADDERKVSFKSTQRAYGRAFAGDPIIEYFSRVSADDKRADLDSLRNMLTHRASPPRAFRLSTREGPSATITRLGIEVNSDTTAVRVKVADRILSEGLNALQGFIDRH